MRYPGSYRHQKTVRAIVLLAAVAVFAISLSLALHKQQRVTAMNYPIAYPSASVPNPTPTDEAAVVFRLYDGLTNQPLSGQSIALIALSSCPAGQACPAASPTVMTADQDGRVRLPQSLVRLSPKLYVSGYKLDNYFSFLRPDQPNQLTLYQAIEGVKLTYDISIEEVPIWLAPVQN